MRARPFVLSHSSMERLERCKRAHYWAVYGPALPDRELARLAGLLKLAKGLPQIVGDVVHHAAQAMVQFRQRNGGDLPAIDLVQDRVTEQFHRAVRDAQAASWRAPLLEEFYGVDDVPGRVEQARQELVHVVQSLLLNRHLTEPHHSDLISEWSSRFEVGDDEAAVPVHVIADHLYRAGGDRRVVVEWKTGQVRGATEQVGLYVLALTQREALQPEQVVGVAVYLAHYQEAPLVGSAEIVEAARVRVRKARRAAQELVLDGDLQENQPQHLEVFEQLPEGSKECRWCSFRRLCGRG